MSSLSLTAENTQLYTGGYVSGASGRVAGAVAALVEEDGELHRQLGRRGHNLAEQALRIAKLHMKIAGGFLTAEGTAHFACLSGLIETARR